MQKIRKILRAVSEKTTLPPNQPTNQSTNQPTSYYQEQQFSRTWLMPVQKKRQKYNISKNVRAKILQVTILKFS